MDISDQEISPLLLKKDVMKKKELEEMLDAYAQFAADVLDGVKPEIAWENLNKKLKVVLKD
jgi:hypothetical protein